MLRDAGVWLIDGYQRHLSPRKGFCCAYGALHGKGTCSSVGRNIMQERGWLAFFRLMPGQLAACRYAAMMVDEEKKVLTRRTWRERTKNAKNTGCSGCSDIGDCGTNIACTEACNIAEFGACLEIGSCLDVGACF